MASTAPVIAGLAVGVGFIVLFSALFPSALNLELRISQEKAVEIAVRDLTTRYIENPPAIKIYAIVEKQRQEAAYPTIETLPSKLF